MNILRQIEVRIIGEDSGEEVDTIIVIEDCESKDKETVLNEVKVAVESVYALEDKK